MSGRGLGVWIFVSILSFPFFIAGAFAGSDRAEDLDLLATDRPREWVSTFRPVALEAASDAPPLNVDMDVEFAGLQRDKVVVRVLMLVAPQSLPTGITSGAGPEFSLAGQVLRGGRPFESFLYRLHSRPAGGGVPLVFERYLEPGDYVLRVRLEHMESGSVVVTEREIEVPQLQRASVERAPEAPEPGIAV